MDYKGCLVTLFSVGGRYGFEVDGYRSMCNMFSNIEAAEAARVYVDSLELGCYAY